MRLVVIAVLVAVLAASAYGAASADADRIAALEARVAALEAFTGNVRAAQVARPAPEAPAGKTCASGFCPRK